MATAKKRILVVEDEPEIRRLVELHLGALGIDVDLAEDGESGLEAAERTPYDLVVLDLMLPGLDGLEVCRRLRNGPRYVPILMLTARSGEIDRVLGLETGADDYLTKPFSIRELVARVKAILRRVEAMRTTGAPGEGEKIEIADLTIDLARRRVKRGELALELTAKEFDLLVHFARHPGRVFTRSELLDAVWGYGHDGYEHTVNSHINRLRSKIEDDAGSPCYIRTVWGVGYRFYDPAEDAELRGTA